jgi:predicted secreted hydrolase
MKKIFSIFKFGCVILMLFFLSGCTSAVNKQTIHANIVGGAEVPMGFERAEIGGTLQFPVDYGPHPDYQTEWWYYTGNLETEAGRHFGYQLTFFRRGLVSSQATLDRLSDWGTEQVYMAHFAISDIASDEHNFFERFARGALGLAGAVAEPYEVWLENWRVYQLEPTVYKLSAEQDGYALDLTLIDEKGPVLHGDQGYSQKGSDPGNASYYYSQTRLATSGTIQIMDESYQVTGLSWKDHEYSTSALMPGQVGWDWFSIQLQDGYDLMFFQIRRADGSIDPFSNGSLVSPDGTVINLKSDDFRIQVNQTWRSPHSKAGYPAVWEVLLPDFDLELFVTPYMSDQELEVSYTYWEGAVSVEGLHGDRQVEGYGYVELTGYAASMEGEF